ncbi:demethylmenaquinone methyltransferase / 2-methoxy-6-polyprenyl-1,4-benzoquinol methylase [Rhodocyclaceae bacterium]|nr:demethylmenaquinone methyltransferase / 2-methoxy-6-polyprenyl-1,4-benzoquinol methylase [Rhodocyclaceae bacterium]
MSWDPVWEKIFREQAWGKYPGEELIRFVARNFYAAPDRSAVRILEVGCGPGANLWFLAREGFAFAGIDGSSTAIAKAEKRLDDECPGWRSFGELRVGDMGNLPFGDAEFDAVIDNEAVCCNPWDASKAIYAEMARVTKPAGRIFSRTFADGTWGEGTGKSAGHHAWFCEDGPMAGKGFTRFTTLDEIPVLIAGFDVRSVELLTWTLEDRRHEIREWVILGEKPAGAGPTT